MFTDIENHWAKASILTAASKNILKGYPDGTLLYPVKAVMMLKLLHVINKNFSLNLQTTLKILIG
jgi:hypothetical protein